MLDFDRLMNRLIDSADAQSDPETHQQVNAFVRDNPQRAAEAIVSFARVRLEVGADAFADVEAVLWVLVDDDSAVPVIEDALSADIVLAERLFRGFANLYDERTAIPTALLTRLVRQWLKRDDEENDWPNLLSRIRERDPGRAWSILAECWSSPDCSDSKYFHWLQIVTFGGVDVKEDWAAEGPWPLSHKSRRASQAQTQTELKEVSSQMRH